MSSSRSIAAARQRRAGETPSLQQQQNRPRTSIGSTAAFAQQPPVQYQQALQRQQMLQQQQKMMQQQQQLQQQQLQQQQRFPQQQQQQQQRGKIVSNTIDDSQATNKMGKMSVSDAIGLITLRLGRLESLTSDKKDDYDETSESTQVSEVIIKSIISRLEDLEKKGNGSNKAYETKMSLLNDTTIQLQNELQELKDMLSQSQSFILSLSQQVDTLTAMVSSNTDANIDISGQETIVETESIVQNTDVHSDPPAELHVQEEVVQNQPLPTEPNVTVVETSVESDVQEQNNIHLEVVESNE
jgi:hypothetical protein